MTEKDLLRFALALDEQPSVTDEFRRRLDNVGASPLAASIRAMLAATKHYKDAWILEKIATLNQGTLDDLNRSDFQSYIISHVGVPENDLQRCIKALQSFLAVAGSGGALPLAARGAPIKTSSATDLERELGKRVR